MGIKHKNRILDTAWNLFYRDGIHATGVDTIIAEAGVAKMTLYHHFASKEELILAVLRRRDEQWRLWFQKTVERGGNTPEERLLALFNALGKWFRKDDFFGCAFINAAGEYAGTANPVRQLAAEHKSKVRDYVYSLVQETERAEPAQLTDELCLLMEGAIVLAHVGGDDRVAQIARRAARKLLCAEQ